MLSQRSHSHSAATDCDAFTSRIAQMQVKWAHQAIATLYSIVSSHVPVTQRLVAATQLAVAGGPDQHVVEVLQIGW